MRQYILNVHNRLGSLLFTDAASCSLLADAHGSTAQSSSRPQQPDPMGGFQTTLECKRLWPPIGWGERRCCAKRPEFAPRRYPLCEV